MKRAVIGVFILVLVGVIAALLFRSRTPSPPVVVRNGLDPAVIKLIDQGKADVRKAPRSADAWGKLGMVLKASAFHREALECFAHAEKLNPADSRWLYLQAMLLLPGSTPPALEKMRRAAELNAQQFVQLRFGQMLAEAGQWAEAERVFRKLLGASPGHPSAHLGLAQIAHAQGKWEQAIEHLKHCLQDQHTAKSATILLASAQLRLGEAEAARESTRRAAALPPDAAWPDPFEAEAAKYQTGLRPLVEQCQRLLAADRVDEALALIEKIVADYPRAAEGWLYLGRARLMQNDLAAAEKALGTHLQLDPASFDGHIQLGLVFHRQGRLDDALAQFQQALTSKPDSETAHYFAGIVHLQRGNTNAALQSFREALRYQPGYAPAHQAVARLLPQ